MCPLLCTSLPDFVLLHPGQAPENQGRNVAKSSSEMTFKLRTEKIEQNAEPLQESPEDTEKKQQAGKNAQPKNDDSPEEPSGSNLKEEGTAWMQVPGVQGTLLRRRIHWMKMALVSRIWSSMVERKAEEGGGDSVAQWA